MSQRAAFRIGVASIIAPAIAFATKGSSAANYGIIVTSGANRATGLNEFPRQSVPQVVAESLIPCRAVPTAWSKQMEREFSRLAKKEALETITSEESAKLEQLTFERRSLLFSPTSEEVLRRLEEKRLSEQALLSLTKYVTFLTAPHK